MGVQLARSWSSLVEAWTGVKVSDGKSGPIPVIRFRSGIGRSS